MNLSELSPVPQAELPVAQLKEHLRLGTGFADEAVQDGLLAGDLRAALAAIEGRTAKALIARDFLLELGGCPGLGRRAARQHRDERHHAGCAGIRPQPDPDRGTDVPRAGAWRAEPVSGGEAGMAFHEVRFPAGLSFGSVGGPERRTEGREVVLWQSLGAVPSSGDLVRLEAGCDRRLETCRVKFDNILNFRGFPDIPGDDWSMTYPGGTEPMDGGSRRT